jgi:hypothetical protein
MGFAPVNVGHLPLVVLAIWLLTITTFSPVQLLVGLPIYVAVFPFTVLIVSVYHKALKSPSNTTVPEATKHFPVASFSAAMLVGWFVLYGGSSSRGPNLVGFVLALVLFFTLVYRALDKTSPIDEHDTDFFSKAAIRGLQIIANAFKRVTEDPPKTRLAVAGSLRTTGFMVRAFRYLSVWIHGRKGRERIAVIMLLEYMVFLVLVAVSAVLFWALAIRNLFFQ